MARRIAVLMLLLCLGIGSLFAAGQTSKVCFSDACITAEVTTSSPERSRGLMFRKKLEPATGMLFVFEKESQYSFWMKNMLFAIDIIWLDKDKKIVALKENATVCAAGDCEVYRPNKDALYVVETEAGFIQAHRIKPGDQARF
jgi:uncharacterized membrane protein (UPF0127 family)